MKSLRAVWSTYVICNTNPRKLEFVQLSRSLCLSCIMKKNCETRMLAWQLHDYGGTDQLKMSTVRLPSIKKPTDVIVKIKAASVNPIDVAMTNGYGAKTLNILRGVTKCSTDVEFPITLGRDFSGVIIEKGHNVPEKLTIGADVWGVVPVELQGCHAEYVIVDCNFVDLKPSNLSDIEAASILYAGLTAWSSLWITGGLAYKNLTSPQNRIKILILGGSGGVGTLAIQLAKAWNLYVVTTCRADAIDKLKKLGADTVVDYNDSNAESQLTSQGFYDIILDCAKTNPEYILQKNYQYNTYVTLNSPFLRNIDSNGIIGGVIKNAINLFQYNISTIIKQRSTYKWGFFVPSATGIDTLKKFVENQQVVPVVQNVYSFECLPHAYQQVMEGHLRGKLVVTMEK